MRSALLISLLPFIMACLVLLFLSRPFANVAEILFSVPCVESSGKTFLFDVGDRMSDKSRKFRNDEEILELQDSALKEIGDQVVIWVHGFRTDDAEADCIARKIDIALTEQGSKIDVVVFAWPSQFELSEFSVAESIADTAASHLAELLKELKDRKVVLATHSLGARVALEAMRKTEFNENAQLSLLYMIQPAVPATSVRRATLDYTCVPAPSGEPIPRVNFPMVDGVYPCSENGAQLRRTFTGCFADAILKASSVRVTFGDEDPVLGGPFALQHAPNDRCFGPTLPPVSGTASTKLP